MLSIMIPVYNEKYTIREVFRRVRNLDLEKEIIIVDDGSTDGTTEILRSFESAKSRDMKVIYHKENRGKGAAIRTGFARVSGDIAIVQDADLEYDPREIPSMVDLIRDGIADVGLRALYCILKYNLLGRERR